MADLFNEKAKEWDANDMVMNLSSAISTAIIEHVPLRLDMQVMDFGAGTGLISSYVAPLVKTITAVDISKAMLEKLVAKPALQGKVKAVCQDIINKPLAEQFDLIMSAMALHHVEDTNGLIKVLSEHTKSGAILALADLDKEDGSFHPPETEGVYHFGFERPALRLMLEDNGFHKVEFFTAYTVKGECKNYPIFLVVASKP